jgi:hypothetical protein
MSTYHLLDPAARRITWATVASEARAIGYTVKPTGYDHERVGYPRGTNTDHPAAIFTDEPEDMLGTIRAAIAHAQQTEKE